MATPPKISQLKESDLKIPKGAITGEALTDVFHKLFGQLNPYFAAINKSLAKGLTFSDNIRCDVLTAKFTHGRAQDVALHTLAQAAGLVVLGADSQLIAGFTLKMKSPSVATITFWFNDIAAANVPVGFMLLEEGQQAQRAPTFSAQPKTGSGTFAAGDATATITDAGIVPSSIILVTLDAVDTTLVLAAVTTTGTGSATLTGNAHATAAVPFSYVIF